MSRRFWGGVALFSLLMTAASGAYLYFTLLDKESVSVALQPTPPSQQEPIAPPPSGEAEPNPPEPAEAGPAQPAAEPQTEQIQTRNILFTFFSSSAKDVYLIGDFNQWYREPMTKKDAKTWTASVELEPGTYEYLYVVDGRRTRDPYVKEVHNGNSVLTVQSTSQ